MEANDFYEFCIDNQFLYDTLADALLAFHTIRREEMERAEYNIPKRNDELMKFIKNRQLSKVDLPDAQVYTLAELQELYAPFQKQEIIAEYEKA